MTRIQRAHIVASNLHGGGGVQVAASLIDELAELKTAHPALFDHLDLTAEVSTEVHDNLDSSTASVLNVQLVDRRARSLRQKARDLQARYDSVFVVFGPSYSHFRARRRLMGYADVTSVLPNPAETPTMRARLRGAISRAEARRQTTLITETDGFRQAVLERLGLPAESVVVVPNAINRLALGEHTLRPHPEGALDGSSAELVWAYPARDYPHKNLGFLPRVRRSLAGLGVNVRFAVTLRDAEWAERDDEFQQGCVNVGELSVRDVGALIRGSDAVFFPSLLEAFSATPIEALANRTLLLASDREFVRSICGPHAIYFDPTDPDEAARAIVSALPDDLERDRRVDAGLAWASALPSAADRARHVLALLTDARAS